MVETWTHGIDMELTTPMVLNQIHGIVSVLLNHTHSRGPSVAGIRDLLQTLIEQIFSETLVSVILKGIGHI